MNKNTIATIVSYLMIIATSYRGINDHPDQRNQIIPFLVLYLLLMIVQPMLPPNRKVISAIYISLQILLMVALFFVAPMADYWAILLVPSTIYAMHVFRQEVGFIWVAVFAVVVSIMITIDPIHGMGEILIYTAAYIFFASYALMLEQTDKAQAKSQRLLSELEKSNQKLTELASNAEELATIRERNRLARELHDSVTQLLYSLTLLAGGWRRLAAKGQLHNVEEPFVEMEEVAQQALKEMRLLIYELRPPALENEGLQGALHHRLNAVEKRAGVEARLLADEILDLPPAVEETLYAIAVEALNNTLKHAAATSVTVALGVENGRIHMEVSDNGRGFDPQQIEENWGMGLKSMRERVEQLNGDLAIISQPDTGTHVKVEVTI